MRQDDYRHYRATEYRLYKYRTDAARLENLMIERKAIIERIMPSVGVAQYGEHIGRASDSLTGPEQAAEQSLKDGKRLYVINGDIYELERKQHEVYYAVASLFGYERNVITALYFEGQTIDRAADKFRCSEGTIKNHRYNAIRKIGSVLFGD